MTTPAPKKAPAKKAAPKKVAPKKVAAADEAASADVVAMPNDGSYIATVGRRKASVARVRLMKKGTGKITINGRPHDEYFTVYELRSLVTSPLTTVGQENALDVSVKVAGGGIHGQAEAVRHGIARALIELNPTFRKSLKKLGHLTRDSRKKERKKFGLKKARRAPQWSKR
jgi:small subunit ribosomal protein S9